MKFEIKSRWESKVLFSLETKSLKLCVEAAIKRGADLGDAYLRGADLRDAYLRGAYLRGADLRGADLRDADLSGADLRGADLRDADLRDAYLRDADLRDAYLRGAYLRGADLRGADLRDADLSGADLRDADLRGADLSGATGFGLPYQFQTCPRSGSFEAWKKGDNQEIIKLTIPWWARRTANIVDRKCRAEIALVVAIYNKSGKPIGCCRNGTWADRKIDYRVGGFVRSRNYDASWLKNCSNGIHFFMTKEEAENW